MFSAVEQRSHVRSLPPCHIHHQHTCQSHSAEAEPSEVRQQGASLPSQAVEKVSRFLLPIMTFSTGQNSSRLASLWDIQASKQIHHNVRML